MSETEMETEETEWTKTDLRKLFAAMKSNIPEHKRRLKYDKCLKTFDWEKVAFQPFSPEECQQKWREILHKLGKFRSLTELVDEAEFVLVTPIEEQQIYPKRPPPPNAMFYAENRAELLKRHPEIAPTKLLAFAFKEFKSLPDEKKAPYMTKFILAKEEYHIRINAFRKQNNLKPKRFPQMVCVDTTNGGGDSQVNRLLVKPPLNAYNLFCKEQKPFMNGVPVKEFPTVWARRWQSLSKMEKKQYTKRCFKIKQEYAKELKDCVKLRTVPREPEMPPRSKADAYIKEQMKALEKKIPNTNKRIAVIKRHYQEIPKEDKTYYREQVNRETDQYTVRLQRWFKMLKSEDQKNYLKFHPDKCKFLQINPSSDRTKPLVHQPSDSEDEELEDSSSSEEECYQLNFNEDDEDEEEDGEEAILFDAF